MKLANIVCIAWKSLQFQVWQTVLLDDLTRGKDIRNKFFVCQANLLKEYLFMTFTVFCQTDKEMTENLLYAIFKSTLIFSRTLRPEQATKSLC